MAINLLQAIPAIGDIINKIIPDPNKQSELKLEIAKLDAQESIARMGVLQAMMGNKSLFVAGGIPALIWLAVIYLAANYILFPLLAGFGMHIAPIELPGDYWSLLQVIVVGLFGKKVIDGNEWRWGDKLISPAKSQVQTAAAMGDTKPIGAKEASVVVSPSVNYDDPAAVDARLKEIAKEKGIIK